jgi:hypothetical protein
MKRKFGSPVRSLAFWPPGVWIAVALFVAALAVLSPQGIGKAEAYTITGDGRIVVNASQVQVSLHWYEAEFDNVFGMDSPVPQDILSCKSQPADVLVDIGTFDAGELIFRLKTPEGNTWLTGPASRNADNFQHAQLEPISDTVIRIHWEDQYGGGDQDFNDCNVEVTIHDLPTATPTNTPMPPNATSTNTPAPPTSTFTPTATQVVATATATATNTPSPQGCLDLNGDGKVSGRDVAIVARALFTHPGNRRWNPVADVNHDGQVNLTDLFLVIKSMQNKACRTMID